MNPKLQKYIAARDKNLKSWQAHPLLDHFNKLLKQGEIEVGGRSTCGSSVDPTWKEFNFFNEIVKKANSLGYEITVEPVKHGNGWATKSGGWWHSNIYKLIKLPETNQPPSTGITKGE